MSRLFRRAVAAPVITLLAASGALVATAAPALADNKKTLTVVGTSDVFDSNLVQSVIKPDFEAAHPGITLNYVSLGTGAAITYAKSGAASALVVHAASLENQFVADGYSLEPYGRAIFWGDYVLAGPKSDPAGVLSSAPKDIATAFEKVAAAGAAGRANFVSRGGTPGTTVQEHAIWALTNGVPTCNVSATNGGGEAPSTATGDCPTQPANPSWYHTTGLTQGPNILNASTCNYGGGQNCYVFTDRGTFQYLQSTNAATNLRIVTRDNAASARGGETALVNSFHAYGINPAPFAGNPDVSINTTQAKNFLTFITSDAEQKKIGAYLANVKGGSPFVPDAAPTVTIAPDKKAVVVGTANGFKGKVKNVVPGTPALSGVRVSITFTPTGSSTGTVVATGTTDANGAYTIPFTPQAAGSYYASTPKITKIEDDSLDPPFGDILVPGMSKVIGPFG